MRLYIFLKNYKGQQMASHISFLTKVKCLLSGELKIRSDKQTQVHEEKANTGHNY